MKHLHRIVIGDWSDDGHGKTKYFAFTSNYDRASLIKAYKEAVKITGVSLDHDTSYRGSILTDYEDDHLSGEVREKLENNGVNLQSLEARNNEWNCSPKDVVILFLELVRTQLTDLEYELVDEAKPINGFWQEDFNVSMGYGCF